MVLIDLKIQYQGLREGIREAMDGVLDDGHYILGPAVSATMLSLPVFPERRPKLQDQVRSAIDLLSQVEIAQ